MSNTAVETIAGFAASLRDNGFLVGVGEHQAMLRSAMALTLTQHRQLRQAWRALVCRNADDWHRFPEIFDTYWYPQRRRGRVKATGVPSRPRDLLQLVADLKAGHGSNTAGQTVADAANDAAAPAESPQADGRAQGGASRVEPLAAGPRRLGIVAERRRMEQEVRILTRQARRQLSRQQRPSASGLRLDIRKTCRHALSTGGLMTNPVWRRSQWVLPRFFILVDVSRSMETFAPLFMALAEAFHRQARARVFVFHTRLAEITDLLGRSSPRVQERVAAVTAGFAGGTRIASCIADFLRQLRGRLGRAHLLILSDGYDSDAPDHLATELAHCRGRGARIYWLHPTRQLSAALSLQAALPQITAAAPLYDVDSLARLRTVPFWSGNFPWKP